MNAFRDVVEPLQYVVDPVSMLEYICMMQNVFAVENALGALGWTAHDTLGPYQDPTDPKVWAALHLIHDTLRSMRLVVSEGESQESSLDGWGWKASGLWGYSNGRYHNVEGLIGRLTVGSRKLREALGIAKIECAPVPLQAGKCKLRLEGQKYKTFVYAGREHQCLMDAKIYVYGNEQTLKCGKKARIAILRLFDALIKANGGYVTRAEIDPENPTKEYGKIRKDIPILETYVIWGSSHGYALSDKAFENATS
jgi:hypothetical protein